MSKTPLVKTEVSLSVLLVPRIRVRNPEKLRVGNAAAPIVAANVGKFLTRGTLVTALHRANAPDPIGTGRSGKLAAYYI